MKDDSPAPSGPYTHNPEVIVTMTEGKGWVWGMINDAAFCPPGLFHPFTCHLCAKKRA